MIVSEQAAMAPRIAIVYYSMFGHVRQLAEAEKRGVEAAGGSADLFQVAEYLPDEVLAKVGAPPRDTITPLANPSDLEGYDGFLFGVPTRYGTWPTPFTAFWDAARPQWQSQALNGKAFGAFVSCSNMGAGMETTTMNMLPTCIQHGMIYVPMGGVSGELGDFRQVSGGSPWGAGCFAGPDGSRMPTQEELTIATRQGDHFCRAFRSKADRSTGMRNLSRQYSLREASTGDVLILIDSTTTQLRDLAEAQKRGIEAAGGSADIRRIANFPPSETAAAANRLPIIEAEDLLRYEAILFGLTSAYHNSMTLDWRVFWDKTGGIWFRKGLFHKAAGVFGAAETPNVGVEGIFRTALSTFAHQGMYFIPLGHAPLLPNEMEEVNGASTWGAGTIIGRDGLRSVSNAELKVAEDQGLSFYEAYSTLDTFNFAGQSSR